MRPTNKVYRSPGNVKRREWIATREYTQPVLDVGCAEGWMTSAIPGDVTGFDRRLPDEWHADGFIQGDVYDMPFCDDSFGTVCAFEMLEHLHEPVRALHEMFRVCTDKLYVTVPAFGCMTHTKGHVQNYEDIGVIAASAGFKVVSLVTDDVFAYLEASCG